MENHFLEDIEVGGARAGGQGGESGEEGNGIL
jgi:hypothetical protein